jgi:hypothetical protein
MIILIKNDRYFDLTNGSRTKSRFIFLKMPITGLSLGAARRALEREGRLKFDQNHNAGKPEERLVLRHQIGGWGVG